MQHINQKRWYIKIFIEIELYNAMKILESHYDLFYEFNNSFATDLENYFAVYPRSSVIAVNRCLYTFFGSFTTCLCIWNSDNIEKVITWIKSVPYTRQTFCARCLAGTGKIVVFVCSHCLFVQWAGTKSW